MSSNEIVITKQWLADKIAVDPQRVIGRALLAIYNEQTDNEQCATATRYSNGRGFTKPDARVGSIGARMYAADQTLAKWQVDCWSKPDKSGYPRICKYVSQLSVIANRLHDCCAACAGTGIDLLYDEPQCCVDCGGVGFVPKQQRYQLTPYGVEDEQGNVIQSGTFSFLNSDV